MASNIPGIESAVGKKRVTFEPQPILHPMGLWELDSPKYRLKICPIQIVVEVWPDNEYIAHWHDVEAIGFGKGKEEAIDELRNSIIDLYERLSSTKDKELGKLPLRSKKILQKAIEKVK